MAPLGVYVDEDISQMHSGWSFTPQYDGYVCVVGYGTGGNVPHWIEVFQGCYGDGRYGQADYEYKLLAPVQANVPFAISYSNINITRVRFIHSAGDTMQNKHIIKY